VRKAIAHRTHPTYSTTETNKRHESTHDSEKVTAFHDRGSHQYRFLDADLLTPGWLIVKDLFS